jgi:hypothetical protein
MCDLKTPAVEPGSAVTIRESGDGDRTALRRLAELDSARPLPAGRALLAQRDGETLAALSLTTGAAVADPFRPTAAIVGLLEFRAAQLRETERRARPRRRLSLTGTLLRVRRAAT